MQPCQGTTGHFVQMAREASHGVWGVRSIHTNGTEIETSGTREIWSNTCLEQVGPRSIRMGPSIRRWKRGLITLWVHSSTSEFDFLVFGYSGESCNTFQTRLAGLDECVLCNWEHEKSVTSVLCGVQRDILTCLGQSPWGHQSGACMDSLRPRGIWNSSVKLRTPHLISKLSGPLVLCLNMGGHQSKLIPLQCMLDNFKKE
jgi:hypothetical protein